MIRTLTTFAFMALSILPCMAAPSLIMQSPDRVWRCMPHDERTKSTITLFFFDKSLTVDRYGVRAELDRVDGIDLVVEVRDDDGEVSEFTFGRHQLGYTEYRFSMQFTVRPGPNGPGLTNYAQPAVETVIDRVTGEMRLGEGEEVVSVAACEAAPDTFAITDAEYFRLLVGALDAAEAAKAKANQK